MEAVVLLADYAEAINGKLYVQGAGWTEVRTDSAIRGALAALIDVGWDETNKHHDVALRLLDPDGHPAGPSGMAPVVIETGFEVGRPPGVKPGTPIRVPLAANFMVPLQAGRYRFQLEIDNDPIGNGVTFEVIGGVKVDDSDG